jgi:hypothetical protein
MTSVAETGNALADSVRVSEQAKFSDMWGVLLAVLGQGKSKSVCMSSATSVARDEASREKE